MADWKAFFTMTRHERAGAVVVLVLLAVVICAHVALSRRGVDAGDINPTAVTAFEQQCDSVNALKASRAGKAIPREADAPRKASGSRDTKSASRTKEPAGERGLAPVPGF